MKLPQKLYLTLILLSLTIVSCQENNDSIALENDNQSIEILNSMFTDYEVVTLSNEEILKLSELKKEEGFTLDLNIEDKPNWVFDVQFHDFYSDDYQAYESDANGDWIEVETNNRSDAFHGPSIDKENRAMFIMEDEHFSGEIYEGEIEYGLEPLKVFNSSASPDQYVYYRLDADIAALNAVCGNDEHEIDQFRTDDLLGNQQQRAAQCREMTVTYVADYEYYQKFNRNSSSTRSYIENRLRYGSYRYWGYNDFPLYFRLWNSYVRTNTSNRPATSSNSSTFLSQWRTWGRNGNIGQADDNLLYTGRDFGGLFGRAYIGAVCRTNNSGQRKAYGIVTKINGVSSSVYSKVTGHEVGHNLGANHQSTGFMKQGTHSNSSMPSATRNELTNYISSNNSCMPLRDCVNYR